MTESTSGTCWTSPARSPPRSQASPARSSTRTRTFGWRSRTCCRPIGEAARRISREFQKAHPEIPWAGIVGMRHKVVHDYMDVDEEVVWKTSIEEIPRLVAALEPFASR